MHFNLITLTISSIVHTILFLRPTTVQKKLVVYMLFFTFASIIGMLAFTNHNMIILGYNTLYILNLF